MLGCAVQGYTKGCTTTTGGVDQLFVGDANDFDLTAGAPGTDGNPTGYSSIALHTGATAPDAGLFEIQAVQETIGLDIAQANADGSNSSYEYTLTSRLAQMSQAMTNFTTKLDAAALCCQMIFVCVMNDGTILIFGERNVGTTTLNRFRFRQDGSRISTGKKFTDFNGNDLSIKGSYSRLPYVFTGGLSAILAFVA